MTKPNVLINEVGPRDGLQNQPKTLSADERLDLVKQLMTCGIRSIEVGSFVSPKAVPAMAGTADIFASLPVEQQDFEFRALIPNKKGFELAKDSGCRSVLFVAALSETMNQKNVRMTVEDSLAIGSELFQEAKRQNIEFHLCLAVAFECPFEGKMPPSRVFSVAERLFKMGLQNLVIADTIGAATPKDSYQLLSPLVKEYGSEKLTCHFHDTRALGLANAYQALEAGVRSFDASIGGLGGCPFAPGASGNVATEDLVMLFEQVGFNTGIELEKLMAVGQYAGTLTETPCGGRAHDWRQLQLERGKAIY